MEVHSHTHTPRKKWTHYLWEFFMLFLAVFCGFLAENQREHYIEHQREKQYIKSMIGDLQSDTANMRNLLLNSTVRLNNYDSLRESLKDVDAPGKTDLLYYYFLPTTYYNMFLPTKRTIDQLENSGGLRLIRSKETVDTISDYYHFVDATVSQGNTWLRYFDQYHEVAFRVFDYSQIDTIFYARRKILEGSKDYTLLTSDKSMLKLLYNKLFALRFILASYVAYIEELNTKAISTLNFLKKEYHFE